ncbi:MAG: hypothetical protein WDZ59_15960 [Pirellulales bacterium]
MDITLLRRYLAESDQAAPWLRSLGLDDTKRGHANLLRLAEEGVPDDLLAVICAQLEASLPKLPDPDMALNNLERFFAAARSPLSTAALFERDTEALGTLLQIFSTSQYLSDLLISDPGSYELLRMTEGQPVARNDLVAELVSEVDAMSDDSAVLAALRRFKRRETLRISYGDIIRGQPLETVARQISYLADAILEAAVRFARRRLIEKRGTPRRPDGQPSRFVVLALGKLGGEELNYSSDVDLILLHESEGRTDGPRPQSNAEFFERLARDVVGLLTERTSLGTTYRVDLRLRPEGSRGPITINLDAALQYYDVKGRTWERQAYIKARPAAGDLDLGEEFLRRLEPWIYRRYLSLDDITGIKALKRRIEQQSRRDGGDRHDVKTGHGGLRDIEFTIQFLQLINAGDLPELRTGTTLQAIIQLEQCGCLTFQERSILEENYRFLRKLEHRLQILFDLQTHLVPNSAEERRKIALRMGYTDQPKQTALAAFETDLESKTAENRKILDHLLHDAFGEDADTEPEVDLVNDPSPSTERIEEVLGRYPFRDVPAAYRNLMALATERIRFLSPRRCRHFLASIAPRLLRAIAATPDPDSTLVNLSTVSDSLGGKGVLWELLSVNRPSLELYVKLCAACPYLAGILTSNPGMIDELTDSLLMEKLPTLDMLQQTLADLCRGAEDITPILHSFKDSQHLRVGVRDIVGKDDIQSNCATLSDIAETCLRQIATSEFEKLVEKFGRPTIGGGKRSGQPCELVILAMGKLGGREPNYHSDLDIIFLYDAEGTTEASRRAERVETTTNQHFFGELGQRIIKTTSRISPYGRLYEVDPRLRPTGRSGALAVPLAELNRYFASGTGQLWERQALCKARVIYGSPEATELTMRIVHRAAFGPKWSPASAAEIRHMRARLEETASPRNLKRGRGGTVDVDFLVQMLQLKHGGRNPQVRVPGTLAALAALCNAGYLATEDFDHFAYGYRFQRSVEARIRLMAAAGRHELPTDTMELRKLAYLLDYPDAGQLVREADHVFEENRRRFERVFEREMK